MTHEKAKQRPLILLGVTASFLVLFVLVGVLILRDDSPPPVSDMASREDAIEVLTGTDFSGMDDSGKDVYAERISSLVPLEELKRDWSEFSPEQQSRLKKNLKELSEAKYRQELDTYFQLPEKQRTAHLDAEIDSMIAEAGEKADGSRTKGRTDGSEEKRRAGRSSSGVDDWVQTTPAEERARILEYKRALVDRMEQRGIQWP
jgi:hypothetical protein